MDPKTAQILLGAAGAGGAAAGAALYVDDVFSTFLYEGNGGAQTITNNIDLSGEGGLVWIKGRDGSAADNMLFDTGRGVQKTIQSNDSNAEVTRSTSLTAFNSNGFSLGGYVYTNGNSGSPFPTKYCSWTFRKAPKFLDIVTYTGDGANPRTVNHSLGSVPGMILVKCTSHSNSNWMVYHRSTGLNQKKHLNTDEAQSSNLGTFRANPTATTFAVGGDYAINFSNQSYVAYIFAHDEQSFGTNSDQAIIKCDSYEGVSSGTRTIDLGFEPQWLLIKNVDSNNQDWFIYDNMRGLPSDKSDNVQQLIANGSAAEAASSGIEINSQGFVIDSNKGVSGDTYIYMAIRRSHKPPAAGTDVFAVDTLTATDPAYTSNFPVDLIIRRNNINSSDSADMADRLTDSFLYPGANSAASDAGATAKFARMDGWDESSGADSSDYGYMFKRAAGFFDLLSWTGTGSATTVNHNLDVAPELVIVKRLDGAINWYVQSAAQTSYSHILELNNPDGQFGPSTALFPGAPSATSIQVGTNDGTNASGSPYLGLLFATLSGVSKVGSYSGTGNDINVDCGFSAGARFILIKRVDATGDWHVFDSSRGIVSGNDPFWLLNTNAAQVTSNDYIDPLNAGFTVTSSAPAALNTSGGTYLFLAIA